ncbi:Protein mpe1 [Diatrype stigma]|uniref:Protein mpe1 n=1 Tax=Diatrype stigma TaxID=117547 RepID=A0AAN9YV70_9PEZI
MAKSELEQLFDESTSDPVTSRELRSHRESAAYIQPTAIRSPQKPLGNISNKKQEDAFGKKQQIGANDHPLGQRHTHSNSKGGTGGVDNEDCRYNQPYTTPKKNASSSLLLGDTYAPLDPGTDELTIVQEAALQRSAERMPRAESSKGAYGGHSLPPPPNSNYICKRCNKRGHWIQFCPTNLDPSWDKPPAPSYRCEICGQTGKHFGTLCPFNKKESSLTQQRERASIKTKSPIRDEGDNHADTSAARGLDRIVRSDEGRLSYDDELYIDAQSPPPAPKTKKTTKAKKTKKAPKSKPDDQLLKEGNVLEHEGPEPVLNTEEVEQSKQDTDQFLRELEAEILAARSSEGNSPIHVPFEAAMLQGTREDLDNNVGIDETNMDETNSPQSDDTCTVKDDSTSFEAPDGNRYRLVTETHFRPEIRALFNSRANPIINNRSNRKAASQMWTFF